MSDNHTADQIIKLGKENWSEMSSLRHDFIVYLNRIRDLGFAKARTVMSGFNLSPGEFDILVTLRSSAKPYVLSPGELQKSVLITSGGLTKLLYQLEASGLINRSVQEHDKRSKLVHLTSKGKNAIEKAMSALMKIENAWLGDALTQREQKQLKNLLAKVVRVLENANEI